MALRLAVDANRYVDFCKGVESAVHVFRRATEIMLPFVVVAELRAGFRAGSRRSANEKILAHFLQQPRVGILFADEATTLVYADLYAELRTAGTPIPTNDLWVAALVVQHGLTLFSRDKHFDRLPHIPRV
jgi:tRNA(fMet)-specific endonuclease VapC